LMVEAFAGLFPQEWEDQLKKLAEKLDAARG
jgi:hypothetical protein